MKKRRTPTERLRELSQLNGNFDVVFWQKAGALARFAASWQMLKELYKIKGKDGNKFRLRRFIQRIQQI